jgi:hypothetical protein
MTLLRVLVLLALAPCSLAATTNINWFRQAGNQGTKSISLGDTVTWTLTDTAPHTVTSTSGGFASSGDIQGSGFVYSVTFNSAGVFPFQCGHHGTMQGVISVTASPTRQPTAEPSAVPSTAVPSTTRPSFMLSVAPTISHSPSAPPSSKPSAEPTVAPSSPTSAPSAAPTQDTFEYVEMAFPEVISSGQAKPAAWNLTLQLRAHRHENSRVAFNTRSYCYEGRCSYPGPTISLKPGDNCTLILENQLEQEEMGGGGHVHNTIHSSNVSNLHTHG